MSQSQHHQSIRGSRFGDYATVCLVHNDYGGKRQGKKRLKGHLFLAKLSPPIPECPLQHGSFASPSHPRELFGPVINSFSFHEWQAGKRGPALIIQDPTSTWHCTLFREAQKHLSQSGIVGSYLPTPEAPDAETKVTLADVLRGIMWTLLVQCPKALRSVRKKFQRRVDQNTPVDLLEAMFKYTIARVMEEETSRNVIYIIIRGVSRIDDELAALLAYKDRRIQWLLMLPPWVRIPPKLAKAASGISVKGLQVARSAGLGHVVDFVQRYGNAFRQRYATVKEHGFAERLSPDDLAWFRYTSAGRLLLLPIHQKTVVSYRYLQHERHRLLVSFVESLMSPAPDSGSRPFLYLDDAVLGDATTNYDVRELVLAVRLALLAQLIICTNPCYDDAAEKAATMLMFALEHDDGLIPELSAAVHGFRQEGDTSVFKEAQRVVQVIQDTRFSRAFVRQASSVGRVHRIYVLVNARQRDADPALLARSVGALGSRFALLVSRPCNDLSGQPSRPTKLDGESFSINHVNPDSELKELLDSLSNRSILAGRRPGHSALHGTNEWLWNDAVYKTWMHEGGVLLIAGHPGSGKSILAKTISGTFQKLNVQEPGCVPTWFCKEQRAGKPDEYVLMLRSILWQTLSSHKDCFRAIRAKTRSMYDDHGDHPQWDTVDWKFDDLDKLLRLLGRWPEMPKCVWVIDALDEPDGHAAGGQTPLAAVTSALIKVSTSSLRKIRIIVLSRPVFKIKQAFEGCLYIDMNRGNRQDVSILVCDRLGLLRSTWSNVHHEGSRTSLPPEDEIHLGHIGDFVADNASGIMLWVVLIFQQLLQMINQDFSIRSLRQRAAQLPTGLEKLYESILKDLGAIQRNGQLSTKSRIIFQWIIGTSHWEGFRLCDLREALAIPSEPTSHHHHHHHHHGLRGVIEENLSQRPTEDVIYRHCGPLVEVAPPRTEDNPDRTVKVPRTNAQWTVQLNHKVTRSWLQKRFRELDSKLATEYVEKKLHEYVDIVLPMSLGLLSRSSVNPKYIPAIIDHLGKRQLLKFAFRRLGSCDDTSMEWFKSRLPSSALASQQSGPMQYLRSKFSSATSSLVDRDVNMRILDRLVKHAQTPGNADSGALENTIEFLLAYSRFIRQAARPRRPSSMDSVMMMMKKCIRLGQGRAQADHQCCLCYLAKIMTNKSELISRFGYIRWAEYIATLESNCLREYDGNSDYEIMKLLLIPSIRYFKSSSGKKAYIGGSSRGSASRR